MNTAERRGIQYARRILKKPKLFIDLEINGHPLIGRGTSKRIFKKIRQENGGEVGKII